MSDYLGSCNPSFTRNHLHRRHMKITGEDTSVVVFSILFGLVFALLSLSSLHTVKMVVDAVIYHPTVSHYLKYVATTGTYFQVHPIARLPQLCPSTLAIGRIESTFCLRWRSTDLENILTENLNSRPRQSPPPCPILLPLLRMVPLPDQQSRECHPPLRCPEEAAKPRP